jgi:ankyrin repeat protein
MHLKLKMWTSEMLPIVDDRKNIQALHWVALNGLTECCQLILESDQTAHLISIYSNLEIVKLLLNTKQGLSSV